MLKTISVSDLRAQVKRIMNEVGYGQSEYIIEKFGEPTAAIINISDFQLLQQIKQQQPNVFDETEPSFVEKLAVIHQTLFASSYRPRTKDEIDFQIQAERESWGL